MSYQRGHPYPVGRLVDLPNRTALDTPEPDYFVAPSPTLARGPLPGPGELPYAAVRWVCRFNGEMVVCPVCGIEAPHHVETLGAKSPRPWCPSCGEPMIRPDREVAP